MANWDQDIHRIQEIQQLLESRQRFFGGKLKNAFYKVDKQGNPAFLPSMQHSQNQAEGAESPTEPSIGQSLEANAGSTPTGSHNDLESEAPITVNQSEYESDPRDSSDGHEADRSHDCTTPFTSSDDESKTKRKKSKKANRFRKWVESNVEQASDTGKEVGLAVVAPPSASPAARKKSVSFEDRSKLQPTSPPSFVQSDPAVEELALLNRRRVAKTDPLYLLKRKSWLLRNEVARRLDETDLDIDRKNVLHRVTKSTLNFAREKLKKAEKSLSATVKEELKKPVVVKGTGSVRKGPEEMVGSRPEPIKKTVSRLTLRQAEEALKSDLNLREAFALIKIDPDPLLDLAQAEKDKDAEGIPKKGIQDDRGDFRRGRTQRADSTIFDDPETLKSLRRLTKLSAQHRQKQKSLVPERITELQLQKKRTKRRSSQNLGERSKTAEGMARKGSVMADTISDVLVATGSSGRRRMKDYRRNTGPKIAFSNLEATLRAEREGYGTPDPQLAGYRLEKLAGTIL